MGENLKFEKIIWRELKVVIICRELKIWGNNMAGIENNYIKSRTKRCAKVTTIDGIVITFVVL